MTRPATNGPALSGVRNRLQLAFPSPAVRLSLLAAFAFLLGLLVGLITTDAFLAVPPAEEGSWGDVAAVLRSNLSLLFVLAACAGLQSLAREEAANGSKPWISWITTLVVVCFVGLNVGAVGVVIGHLGMDAVVRILPHAPLEVGGFVIGIYVYLRAREGNLAVKKGAALIGLGAVLILAGALVESFISGGV